MSRGSDRDLDGMIRHSLGRRKDSSMDPEIMRQPIDSLHLSETEDHCLTSSMRIDNAGGLAKRLVRQMEEEDAIRIRR